MENEGRAAEKLTERSERWKVFLIALGIFDIALILRMVGLKFGFPLLTHPDEAYLMGTLRGMSADHTLNTGTYIYPAFPSLYVKLFVLNRLSFQKFGEVYGQVFWQDPFFFYYFSRLITAVYGALLPVVAWFIGRKYKKIDFSWLAAILFTFYPPFVLHSHYISVDIPLTLYVMLVLLFGLNYLSSDKKHWLVLASLMVSVAAMEKYPGILSFGILLVTIGVQAFKKYKKDSSFQWHFFWKTTAISLLVIIVGIALIGLPMIRNFDIAWKQIVQEARPDHLGSDGLGWGGNLLYYLGDFYVNAGLLICLLGVIGLAAVFLMKDPAALLLFFGGGYWIALSVLSLHHSRWSLPMMTTPLFLAAVGASFLWQKLKSRVVGKVAFAVLLLAGFVPFVLKGTVTSVMLTWQDTRNEALHYMEEYGMSEEMILSDGYTPYNPNNKNDIYEFDFSNPREKRFIIISSLMEDRYRREPERYLWENAFYDNIRIHSELIKDFLPDPEPSSVIDQVRVIFEYLDRQFRDSKAQFFTGPRLEIYKLKQ